MKKIIISIFTISVILADQPWIQNVRVSTDVVWDTLNQGESCFTVWKDSIFAICNTAERADVPIAPYAYSFDGGSSFVQIPFTDWSTGITWHTDPLIGVDDSGNVHMVIQFYMDMLNHYISRDGGLSWSDTTMVTGTGVDKPWMVVNKNEIYIVWQQTSGNTGIRLAKSTDYGRTFTQWEIVDMTGITALTMDENEVLHLAIVAWYDGIYYMKSYDKGQTWTTPLYLSDYYYQSGYGDRAPINSITVKGDVIFITWVDTRYSGWDILAMRSEDGGNTWTGPFAVNEDMTGGQFKGWASFDPYGGLHVTYYSTPDWPTDQYSLFSYWYRFSPDSGKTFLPAIRVSDTEFRSWSDFLGDYHINLTDSNYVYAIWSDGRNGNDNDLYFSKLPLSQTRISENPSLKNLEKIKYQSIVKSDYLEKLLKDSKRIVQIYNTSGRKMKSHFSGVMFIYLKDKKKKKIFKIISFSE